MQGKGSAVMSDVAVVLTDPKPLPVDTKCPQCRGDERVTVAGFGVPREACRVCGYQFPEGR